MTAVVDVSRMKAREWLQRSREQSDPMDVLSDLWRAFNNLYLNNRVRIERDKILSLLEERMTELQARELLSPHAGDVEYLLSQPVVDMRGNGRDTAPNIKRRRNPAGFVHGCWG